MEVRIIGTAKRDIGKTSYLPHPLPLPLRKNKEKQCYMACNTGIETDKLFWGGIAVGGGEIKKYLLGVES